MRRVVWLSLSLAAAAAAVAPTAPATGAEPAPRALGTGPAYEAISRLPVLHEGRKKPLDTLAREEVRQIFGRETIKLLDATRGNQVTETWGPVAALLDWSVRPEFWDDQPIILVEYVPLKRLLLADTIKARLEGTASKPTTPPTEGPALRKLAADPAISAAAVQAFLATSKLPDADRAALAQLASVLSEEHKWLTPRQLEEARVVSDGQTLSFDDWFGEVVRKKRRAEASATGDVRLTEVEKRASEVGTRLVHYQAIRDRAMRSVEPMLVMPRPSNKAYLAFLGKTYEKAQKERRIDTLTPLELDGAKALDTFWNELPQDEREVPSANQSKFNDEFSGWLRTSSAWIPLKALLDTPAETLAEAGFPADKASAFQKAFKELDAAENAAPGALAKEKAEAFLAAARGLGESVNPEFYPTVPQVDREVRFNASNPFWKAPVAYGLATALLAACIGFLGLDRRQWLGKVGVGLYALGLVALVVGIGFESLGFYDRVLISGWAPVTNMYETVIWVSLVAAVMGLVFEGVYRKAFAGLSGAGVALLGTVLAANVPLLDPQIKQLQPVLRSNYWLTIHVLTEVSSYGAFLMAALLGLIATGYYLTATFRRSPTLTEMAVPLIPGLPLLAVGLVGRAATNGAFGPSWEAGAAVQMMFATLALSGLFATVAGVAAFCGEVVARSIFHGSSVTADRSTRVEAEPELAAAAVAGSTRSEAAVGGSSHATATLTKPTVAEIRARAAAGDPPRLDARGRAMQATAAQIKPLANFIYRAMQVGVLLIAAGTILGGIWADYSWGRFWGWDPKEVWALITLLVYLVPLHGRFAGWINTFWLVWASVFCSMSVIMAWYGVNFVLGVGLHSYGFVEGGGQGIVSAVCVALVALPTGAAWRRFLASRPEATAAAA